AVSARASESISASTSLMPSAAPRSANARPNPLAAPVITATLPSNACMTDSDSSNELDELLAEVAPLEKPHQSVGRMLEPLHYAFAIGQLLLRNERGELGQRPRPDI